MSEASQNPLSFTPPPATGMRQEWSAIPENTRSEIEKRLGSPVITAISQATGFSPGVAARLQLADGRRLFIKAISPDPNPTSAAFHRREAQIVAALPDTAPIPKLLGYFDEGEAGWVALWFEEIDGRHPAQPWNEEELKRVMEAIIDLSALLTPSPLVVPLVPLASETLQEELCGWTQLANESADHLEGLSSWASRHLDNLVALEKQAPEGVAGVTLLHFDLRGDNMLLTSERVWIFDWPHARIGAAWADVVFFAPSVAMQGGPPPERLLALHPASLRANPDAITAVIAATAGFFIRHSLQPAPPGLPTLRAFQAAQGVVALDWLAERTGWR